MTEETRQKNELEENKIDEIREKIKIIFLIINWNGREKIERCLASLRKHLADLNHKILVVDNYSEDGSCELIRERFPEVWLLINPKNLGFARAANRGINYLKEKEVVFDYLCLLNNDVELRDNSFIRLIKFMDENKEVAACLPALLDRKDKPQSGIAGFNLSLRTAWNHFFFLSIFFPLIYKGLYINQNYFYQKRRLVEVDWLTGAALVIRQSSLVKAGPMPEYFFMYAEDLAYSEQLKKAGKLIYYPGAKVYHLQDEKEKEHYQTKWLDSSFDWFLLKKNGLKKTEKRLEKLSFWSRVNLLILKLIFLGGLGLRCVGYYLLEIGLKDQRAKIKTKEMAFYISHLLKTFLKRNLKSSMQIN
ncbi:MAG: glycosyltransferase family 2 protein [Candidatus Aminicenantes bacterium]|nr:glycosyltransferase family 2 protein [Candidatus Aminicenantes bacterium]